jgi:hypothetical protein
MAPRYAGETVSILVLCPSRNRPQNAADALESFSLTSVLPETRLMFLVDADDETATEYPPLNTYIVDPPPGCMNAAMTEALKDDSLIGDSTILGFIGDDHRFRTESWDEGISFVLGKDKGIVYCDDLYQRQNLPTMWFLSREVADRFGMGHPDLRHLWIDNYWLTLGVQANCIYYMPGIVIEHMHPYAGKGEMDAGYDRVNSGAMIEHDRGVYERWVNTTLREDVATLRAIVA